VIMYADNKNLPHNNPQLSHQKCFIFTTPQHRHTLYERQPLYTSCRLHNHLPEQLRRMRGQDLKRELSKWLTEQPYYSLAEFYNDN
ncbi:hypothetical protein J6590_106252, partial [Homalodisca vitripennis]